MANIKKNDKQNIAENNKLTVLQICNELKIIGYYRNFVYHKYRGQKLSLKEWKVNFDKDGLDIK